MDAEKLEKAYRKCLERERDRERKYAKSAQGAFERAMLPLDALGEYRTDPSALCGSVRSAYSPEHCRKCINRARMKIARVDRRLLRVFYLVIRNGKDWRQSVCELMNNATGARAVPCPAAGVANVTHGDSPGSSTLHT